MGKKDSNMPQRDCMLSLLHLLPMQDDRDNGFDVRL